MDVMRAVAVPLAILLSMGACAPATTPANAPATQIQSRETTVRITNNNWHTMSVYVVRMGTRSRIGMVESMRTEVLRIPRPLVPAAGDIRLMVTPIGSPSRYLTPTVQVAPGQRIDFTIENHLPLSSVSVWHR